MSPLKKIKAKLPRNDTSALPCSKLFRQEEKRDSMKGWERVGPVPPPFPGFGRGWSSLSVTPWLDVLEGFPPECATGMLSLFLLLPQHPLQKAGAELPYFGISAHQLGFKKAPIASLVLNLRGAGEGRGIVSIIYTIVTPRQNYRTSSSRGSLPYIHKTSVIMYFDLLFFFFFFSCT